MQTRTLLAAVAVFICATCSVRAEVSVFDRSRAADFVQQFVRMKEQLDTARSQLIEAQRTYESVTGSRGLGRLMRNTQLRAYLPDDMKTVYDSAHGGGYAGISGTIGDILHEEQFSGSIDDMQRQIEQRSRMAAATNKAVGLRAYQGAHQRLNQIEGLMDQIDQTQDQKAIQELQARLAGEQAAIQNETTKLQLIAQLQSAEQGLMTEQKREMSRRILNPENQAMPGIR
jgi:type IV secretion system protein VirB5